MASRTYNALGLGWATWIDLDGDGEGPVILTSSKNGTPHAYLEQAEDALRVFGVRRGSPIDNQPGNEQSRSFVTSFSEDALARIKVESADFYKEQFDAAKDTVRTDAEGEAPAKRSRTKKTGT